MNTRKADENLRVIKLVGNVSHQIVGAKLPSNKQLLEVFFYNMRFVKLNARKSAELTIDAAFIFWQQARIPTRKRDKCADQLIKLYDEWKILQKNPIEKMSAERKEKLDTFMNKLNNLFDIAHADAMNLMHSEEDKEFLAKQREDGRPGSMLGIDKNLADKEERSRLRKEQEEARKAKHAEASKTQQSGEFFKITAAILF